MEQSTMMQAVMEIVKREINPYDLVYLSHEELVTLAKKLAAEIHDVRKTREGLLDGDTLKTAWAEIARS